MLKQGTALYALDTGISLPSHALRFAQCRLVMLRVAHSSPAVYNQIQRDVRCVPVPTLADEPVRVCHLLR